MASLAFLLGMVPSTEKVETADDKIRADYAGFLKYESSDELKHFQELEKEVKSSEFATRKRAIKKEKFKTSAEFRKETQLKQLQKRSKGDEQAEGLAELEAEINSDSFIKRKQYLSMSPKERYETTEEYRKEHEYGELKKSEKVLWYFKTKKKYPFKEIERWKETFNEPFSSTSLNRERWMTSYYWADAALKEPYVMADDQSFITDGKNVEFYDNKIRLVTKNEEIEGYKLHLDHGFLIDHFDYTSALISTGKSFRQKFGMFKAKIKMSPADIQQAFWMVTETAVPHIDVVRFEKGKLWCNYFWSAREGQIPAKSQSKTGGSKYTSDFFIVTLEWSPNKLVWKINDKVFKTQTSGVPQEEMYMIFSTALKEGGSESSLPAAMEIDWVRVYKLKE